MKIQYTIPRLPLPSVANLREHWSVRNKRTNYHRALGSAFTSKHAGPIGYRPIGPLVVTIKRVGKRRLDRGDNLAMACKSLRDGIADALGRNDGNNSGIEWRYDQGLCGKAEPWVEVTIEEAG